MRHETILSLCDFTGNWSQPYMDAGYNVIRADLQHGQDIRLLKFIEEPVHGILAAPPCTHFSKAGAHLWGKKGDTAILEGLALVDACLRMISIYRPVWWALENPAGRLKQWLGPAKWAFDPCDFGDAWTKRKFLWGNFTPPAPLFCRQARNQVEPLFSVPGGLSMHMTRDKAAKASAKPLDRTTWLGSTRKVERSATPKGFAQAFFEANP